MVRHYSYTHILLRRLRRYVESKIREETQVKEEGELEVQ